MSDSGKKLKACPKITEISCADGGGLKLCWSGVPEAEKYGVKRASEPDGEYETLKWVKGKTYTDTSAEKDVTYWYKVVASKTLEGKKTSKKSSPTVAGIISDIPAPEGLTAKPCNGKIRLSWKADDRGCSFAVSRRNDFFNQILPVARVDGTFFDDRDIVAGQAYHYSIQSIADGKREGNFSKEVSCIYLDCGQITEVKAAAFGRVFIKVRIVAGAKGYILERSADGKTFSEVARTDSGTALRFTDKADKLFGKYFYRTKAYTFIGNEEFISGPSEAVKVKTR